MKPNTRPVLGALLLLLCTPALAQVTGSFERTLQVTGAVDLSVNTGSGRITVRPGDAATVQVRAEIKAREDSRGSLSPEEKVRRLEQDPPVEQDGNVIRIGYIEDEDLRRNVSISYEVTVPQNTRVKANTGSGAQAISGIAGPVRANTGSGRLEIRDIGSEVDVNTGSGGITLEKINGAVQATTGSGSIQASGVNGRFSGRTGSGSIHVAEATGAVEASTGSGSVEASGIRESFRARTGSGGIRADGQPGGAWSLETGSGTIRLRLPQDAAFEFDLHTNSGTVQLGREASIQYSDRQRREMRGSVAGGGNRIAARTGSGNIVLE